ncbi:DUF1365 family protein [Candidatus Aalborgicola defluviihabitans]|uniref:DUF1365 family protein n=1 Tax=Candidatus Aalborgicola defluviihabitans TaxID=3386187 RepID=UPI0039B9218B
MPMAMSGCKTYPRVWGYTFKPVSLWYCHRAARHGGSLRRSGRSEQHLWRGATATCSYLNWGQTVTAGKVFHAPFCQVKGFAFASPGGERGPSGW